MATGFMGLPRVKPTGFKKSALQGGIASGFLQARFNRVAAEELAEKNKIEREKNEILKRDLDRQDQQKIIDQQNVELTLKSKNNSPTSIQLMSKGSDGGPPKVTGYYYHPDQGANQSNAEIAYIRNEALLNSIMGDTPEGQNLIYNLKKEPEQWTNYFMNNYEIMSDFSIPEKDGEPSVGYYIRTKPLPGTQGEDNLKYAPLFNALPNLKNLIQERNDNVLSQFAPTALKDDGSMSFLKVQVPAADGSGTMTTQYKFYKDGKPLVVGADISPEKAKELIKVGYLQSEAWKKTPYGTKIAVAKAVNDLTDVDPSSVNLGYLMNNYTDDFGLDKVKATASSISGDSQDMIYFATKLQYAGTGISGGNANSLNGGEARSANALALANAIYVGSNKEFDPYALSNNVYNIQTAGNKISVFKKSNLPVASTPELTTAKLTIDGARKGISTAKSILSDQQIIINAGDKYKAFQQGSYALGGAFDTGFLINKLLKESADVFNNLLGDDESDSLLSSLNTSKSRLRERIENGVQGSDEAYTKALEAEARFAKNMQGLNKLINETEDNTAKKVYEARARIEAKKVRLAFQVASLVQGGGTGGGRTISNADFEIIYRSLYGKTQTTFVQNIQQVVHDLNREKVVSQIVQKYGSTGQHNTLINAVSAYMDASFGIARGDAYDHKKLGLKIKEENLNQLPEIVDNGLGRMNEPNFDFSVTGFTSFEDAQSLLKRDNEGTKEYGERILPIYSEKVVQPVVKELENQNAEPDKDTIMDVLTDTDTGFGLNEGIADKIVDFYLKNKNTNELGGQEDTILKFENPFIETKSSGRTPTTTITIDLTESEKNKVKNKIKKALETFNTFEERKFGQTKQSRSIDPNTNQPITFENYRNKQLQEFFNVSEQQLKAILKDMEITK